MNQIQYETNTNIFFTLDLPEDVFTLEIKFNDSSNVNSLKFGEINILSLENKNILKVYAGKYDKFSTEFARNIGGAIASYFLSHNLINLYFSDETSLKIEDNLILAIFEGLFLGNYKFNSYKENFTKNLIDCYLSPNLQRLQSQIEKIQKITLAVNISKTIGQLPANVINPVSLAEISKEISEAFNLEYSCFGEKEFETMGANGILSVGKGSQSQPRMIVLEHKGRNTHQDTLALVGKAITFDTGGYSLKSVENIQGMKFDKLGGMTVLGTLIAASLLNLPQRIVGIICAAENMISDHAYRPDDIIRTLSGKTVEIITTDAEGRLVLADGITYAKTQYSPKTIIDFATLTGGIVTALGKIRAGLFSNNDQLADELFAAGEITGERLWRMPLDDEYFEFIKGDDADLKNSGGRLGHPIMGGIFLKQFVNDQIQWAHIDIAGTATCDKQEFYKPKGANGFGIRLMINYLNSNQ